MTPETVTLHEIANARSGDKGNRLNIALVCRDPAHYPAVAGQITAERVAEAFATRSPHALCAMTCRSFPRSTSS